MYFICELPLSGSVILLFYKALYFSVIYKVSQAEEVAEEDFLLFCYVKHKPRASDAGLVLYIVLLPEQRMFEKLFCSINKPLSRNACQRA